ncbi:MAG: hypothetical protein AAF085_12595, partial [Planctomycetota bacterium]
MKNGVLYAATAGFLGALLWGAVTYFTEYEIGWIAWGIGAAVGAAMFAGAKEASGPQTGGIALAIALLAILGGKYFAVQLIFGDYDSEIETEITALGDRMANDKEYATSYIADDVVLEYEIAGKPLNYPAGANREEPSMQADYPADVWAEASTRWQAMSEEEKSAYQEEVVKRAQDFYDA